jgi:hypothetical protein
MTRLTTVGILVFHWLAVSGPLLLDEADALFGGH